MKPIVRFPDMLRVLHRLALAIVTVLVCAGIATPALRTASMLVGVRAASAAPAPLTHGDVARPPVRDWRERATGPAIDCKAVESELDEDDEDPLCHVPHHAAVADELEATARDASRRLRGEAQIDTSRFALGSGLPRGPPV